MWFIYCPNNIILGSYAMIEDKLAISFMSVELNFKKDSIDSLNVSSGPFLF